MLASSNCTVVAVLFVAYRIMRRQRHQVLWSGHIWVHLLRTDVPEQCCAAHWLPTPGPPAKVGQGMPTLSLSPRALKSPLALLKGSASLRDAVILHDVGAPRQIRNGIGLGSAAQRKGKCRIHAQQHKRMQRCVRRPQDEHTLRSAWHCT